MSFENVRNIVSNGDEMKREPPRPLMRELAPADPFPVDALGDVLAPAARAINDHVQAPVATCGQSTLAAVTLAVQAYANVELPTSHAKPLSNYFVTVAGTGERKTAVDHEALWCASGKPACAKPIRANDLSTRTLKLRMRSHAKR